MARLFPAAGTPADGGGQDNRRLCPLSHGPDRKFSQLSPIETGSGPASRVFRARSPDSEFTGRRRYINLGPMGCPGTGRAAPVGWITAARGVRLERLLIPYDKAETIRHLKAKTPPDHEQVIRWFSEGIKGREVPR